MPPHTNSFTVLLLTVKSVSWPVLSGQEECLAPHMPTDQRLLKNRAVVL